MSICCFVIDRYLAVSELMLWLEFGTKPAGLICSGLYRIRKEGAGNQLQHYTKICKRLYLCTAPDEHKVMSLLAKHHLHVYFKTHVHT